ncbi:restriction endonuclease (plasmid) [Gordonia polyisoprenivorans]|uniref:restriction endonuclease n=1 Tax=Gordonia polyisoprenivorans TaxID=84595 RepID=UPI002233F00A|nr:restriction endonuclease [Gordonia polyisoprenivorans]
MSTARIPWQRLAPEEMEHTVAMLLCAEHPTAVHFTPGPDGGIDIFVPDGPDGRKVFQVKHFPNAFASSEFRQVRRSVKRVVKTADSQGWSITEWHLVIPRDPSPAYLTKISNLMVESEIPEWSWMGMTKIDILAGNHPKLIDYYLNGGKDRLAEQISDLTALIRDGLAGPPSSTSPAAPLQPSEVAERIQRLQRAADQDPHYRYHFATSDHPPAPQVDPDPWLVAVAGEQHGPIWLHTSVYARSLAV